MRSTFLSILTLWFAMSPAYAWHQAGHKMIAEIAFERLSERQQQHAAAILNAHPRFKQDFANAMPEKVANGSTKENVLWMFQRASIWPDIVPNISDAIRTRYHRGTWHYINLPVYLTDKDEQELAGKLDHNLQMQFDPPLRKNLNSVQALQGNLLVWRDEQATDADKAVAFCWILHLTGDMHQPLHNVALFSRAWFPQGDRGGNSIAVKHEHAVTNLHAIWDGLPNRFDRLSPDANTKAMLSTDIANNQSIKSWSHQLYEMALKYVYTEEVKQKILRQVSYGQNPAITLSPEYIAAASQIARPQVTTAGHRIAALITN